MNKEKLYAEQWDESAKYFYANERYQWLTNKLDEYKTVVEIGCGTGYSTLALVESGHQVIAIDKNADCIEKAKILITERGFEDKVTFLEGDIVTEDFKKLLTEEYSFDIVLCWNVGTYWDAEMAKFYCPYLLEYGLTINQIMGNPLNAYGELIIWNSCELAASNGIPIHIVDRAEEKMDFQNDPWYKYLGSQFGYSKIFYDNLECDSISKEGVTLVVNGITQNVEKVEIVLLSIILE